MKQKYYHYKLWEDWQNGMYNTICENHELTVNESIALLTNEVEFQNVLINVYKNWNISIQVNLSNKGCNRQAWLGQAACCYNHSGNELTTREAWGRLTNIERYNANIIANKFIIKYERENSEIYRNMGEPLL